MVESPAHIFELTDPPGEISVQNPARMRLEIAALYPHQANEKIVIDKRFKHGLPGPEKHPRLLAPPGSGLLGLAGWRRLKKG